MQITELSQTPALTEKAIRYFWSCWGNESNFKFYEDCILHSTDPSKPLPKFYMGLINNEIIASYALLTNDIISRQDLYPWLACLFVNPEHRNKGYASQLLLHGLKEAERKGFDTLYLSSDLENFYERKGWTPHSVGYNIVDQGITIFSKSTFGHNNPTD